MMESDFAFYERRMQQELRRAGIANDEGLRALHLRWANLYRQRLDQHRYPCGQHSPSSIQG
jgi:hypothetical protein